MATGLLHMKVYFKIMSSSSTSDLFVEVIGRDIHLSEKCFGVYGHFNLAGNGLTQLAAIADQHRKWHPVILDEGCQCVDRHTDRCILHDNSGALTAHPGTRTEPHALVFFVGRNMKNLVMTFYLIDHPCQLLARHSCHKRNVIGYQIISDPFIDIH